MTKKFTSIEQFLAARFDDSNSDYIKTEAKFMNSFIRRLVQDHGFSIIAVHDGEELCPISNNDRFEALDHIFSVDESRLFMRTAKDERVCLFLVLGNGDATTIADHNDLTEETEELIFKVFGESVKSHSEELYEMNWA